LGFRCLQDASDETSLIVEERWASQEDLERHVRSADYRNFLGLLESAVEKPEVEFHEVAKTSGMEVIEEMRGGA
jgi:quinol monooxygenase YgiN